MSYYTFGRVEIGFPEDDICCQHCPLMGVESKTDRWVCRRTGEYLLSPKFHVGTNCPVKFGEASTEEQPANNNEGAKISWEFPF